MSPQKKADSQQTQIVEGFQMTTATVSDTEVSFIDQQRQRVIGDEPPR
jgi:hypothetical protein